jgi:hypothetical protein
MRFYNTRGRLRRMQRSPFFDGWKRLCGRKSSGLGRKGPGCWEKIKDWRTRYAPRIAWAGLVPADDDNVGILDWHDYNAFLRKISEKRSWLRWDQSFFGHPELGSPSLRGRPLDVGALAARELVDEPGGRAAALDWRATWPPYASVYFPQNEVLVWYHEGLKIHKKRRKLKRKLRKLEKL